MIHFKDFDIKVTRPAGLISGPEFEPIEETLLRMNNWIEENEILVLNVETLVIPNIFMGKTGMTKRTSSKGAFKIGGSQSSWWYQIFRVWYKDN